MARPTGKDDSEYRNYKQWTYKRWAWEFLRRNTDFQKDCRGVSLNKISASEVADKFGLKVFKDYKEEFRKGSGIPKFKTGVSGNFNNYDGVEPRIVRIKLMPGEVAIRFNLEKQVEVWHVRQQIERAKKYLIDKVGELGELPSHKSHRADDYLWYIRLIDLLHSSSGTDIPHYKFLLDYSHKAEIYIPSEVDGDKSKAQNQFKNDKATALGYVNDKYHFLATRVGRPD